MICPSCKNVIGCLCQMRTASDGVKVCSTCIATYESKIKSNLSTPKKPS